MTCTTLGQLSPWILTFFPRCLPGMQAGSVCRQRIQQVADCHRVCWVPDACLLHAHKGCICSVQLAQLPQLQDDGTPACAAGPRGTDQTEEACPICGLMTSVWLTQLAELQDDSTLACEVRSHGSETTEGTCPSCRFMTMQLSMLRHTAEPTLCPSC